ncbi:TraR/DksA family transcriptional regulator [Rhodohalobacter sp. 8-1]|uniref:TraR/DksA family transcriptional regulator n=1 Tax=Rhodohalobacter sp. 8-1 TaxID=3131972 RepID=UPI0030EBCB6A
MEAFIDRPDVNKSSPFSREELSVFRALIVRKIDDANEEIEFLMQSIREMRENRSADYSSSQHHFADLGSNEASLDVNMRLLERTQAFVSQLKRALTRIDNGTYGVCKVTGKTIAKERLMAAPHTQHSMEAKLMRNRSLN